MKLLTSPSYSSSPSSSSSTLNFDPTLCNSKRATAGCLTAILRRILCSDGLPTHPSDQIRKLDSMSIVSDKISKLKAKQNNTEAANTTSTAPRIVASLMGLESMGELPFEANSSSLSRSRSMNSVDYLGECKQMENLHRRVKSSSSFREMPTFHLHENENFLVLSFESGAESSKEFKSKGRRKEKRSAELKQKIEERGEFKKDKREKVDNEKGNLSTWVGDMPSVDVGNDGELQFANNTMFNVSSEKEYIGSEVERFSQNMKRKEVTDGEKVKRRKKGTACYTEKKVETECSSEDSSPVSVFDFEREDPGTEVDLFGIGMSWRRKLSSELENDQHFNLQSDGNWMNEKMKVKAIENNKHEGSKKKEKQSQECVDIWGEICRLVEDEVVGSNQLKELKRKQGDFESISADLESEIFDHLLYELIDQLVGKPLKALQLQNL